MESNPSENSSTDERGSSMWPLYVLLAVAAAVLVTLQLRRPKPPNEFVGRPLPPLEAAGWINLDRPLSADDLRGKLVLVDFWETTCPACVLNMPKLVKLKDRYRDQGLAVVGLTHESNASGALERYIKSVNGLDWPIGHGAWLAFEQMGIEWLPTYVLYDRAGRAMWGGSDLGDAEEAVAAALARQ